MKNTEKRIVEKWKISGKAVPDDRNSLQAEIPHASWNSDGHAAIFDKKLFVFLSFHEEIWVTWQLTYPQMQKEKKNSKTKFVKTIFSILRLSHIDSFKPIFEWDYHGYQSKIWNFFPIYALTCAWLGLSLSKTTMSLWVRQPSMWKQTSFSV